MIIGKILQNEKRIRFNVDITCTECKKKVPGGMQTGEQYYKSKEFEKELERFMKAYLCGICRDKKRIEKTKHKLEERFSKNNQAVKDLKSMQNNPNNSH